MSFETLSAENPTATRDQRDLEQLALRLLTTPAVAAAREVAIQRWTTIVGSGMTEVARARFDNLIDEHVFGNLLRAANSDANYPKVLGHFYSPAHEWFGMKVPGSRSSAGDSPDNNYTIIPIDDVARYEVSGQRAEPPSADVPITIMNITYATLSSLDWADVEVAPDGSFRITVGPEPADGRTGHVQSKLGASYLFIRDCRADWRQKPNHYSVRRLDPPIAPPRTFEQLTDFAAQLIVMDVPTQHWFLRPFAMAEPNTVPALFDTGTIGGLVGQLSTWARFELRRDEAFIFRLAHGGAEYFSVALHDPWLYTLDYWQHTSTMNNSQTDSAGGEATYVISLEDPGVYNWLDPVGCPEVLMITRVQRVPTGPARLCEPSVDGQLVKLVDLDRHLAETVRRCGPEERKQQIEERRRTFALRYAGG